MNNKEDNMNKKTKKLIIIILLTICFLVGLFGIFYYFNKDGKLSEFIYINKKLAGEKITDGLYLYNLNTEDNYHNTMIIDNNIYVFVDLEDKYELDKINIYNNKKEVVGSIPKNNNYCYIEEKNIICTNEDGMVLYNYKFKKIYEGESAKIIPYKNDIIKVDDNIIYKNEEEYKKVDIEENKYNVYAYEAFDNNLYIFFGSYEGDGFIYNFKDNKCEEYEYYGIERYSDGLYYFDEEKIHLINVDTNEIREYDNPLHSNNLFGGMINNNLLYYFSNDYLKVYDLETGKVKLYDYRINKSVSDVVINNKLIYLVTYDEVYILKEDEIELNEMTTDELDTLLEGRLNDRITAIYDEYQVDIKIREKANLKFDTFKESMVGEDIYDVINDSLDYTYEILNMFGKEFFNEFIHDEYTGVSIYIVSHINSNDFSKAGEAFRYYDKYAIIADTSDFKRTLCHELMHTMEDKVVAEWDEIFTEWDSYNPKGFKYKIKYNPYDSTYKYTLDYKEGDIYFIDNYSLTNGLEDRARIFENICMNTTDDIKNNPYILKKAEYIKEEVLNHYPMLKDTVIFDSLN